MSVRETLKSSIQDFFDSHVLIAICMAYPAVFSDVRLLREKACEVLKPHSYFLDLTCIPYKA